MVDSTQSSDTFRGLGGLESFKCVIKNIDGTRLYDVTSLVESVSIYEDIFSKTMYGNILINDGINLLNGAVGGNSTSNSTFPLVGEEFIELEYKLPGVDAVSRRFALYAIKQIKINSALTMRTYLIDFCAEEYIIDAITLVQKSYEAQLSDMAEDILKTYLKVDTEIVNGKRKKSYNVQPTKGKQIIVIPNISPLEALSFLAKRSIAQEKYMSGTYLFFENASGFNFCDIEFLIKNGKDKASNDLAKYQYYYQNTNIPDGESTGDPNKNTYRTFLRFDQKHRHDTIEKIRRGYFESSVVVYDYINRRVSNTLYKFVDIYKDYNTLGSETGQSFPENSLDFINACTTGQDTKDLGIFSSVKDIATQGRHTKLFFMAKDTSKPDTFLDSIVPHKASYMTRLAQNAFTAEVYGDSTIQAGDVIVVKLPEIIGITEEKKLDTFLSGYFLVSSIHHKLTPESYMCTYDLLKSGYAMPVVATDNPAIADSSIIK